MRFGICTGVDSIADAAEAGYDFIETTVAALVPDRDEEAFEPVLRRLREAPLRVEAFNCFLPGQLKVTGPQVDLEAVRRHMQTAISRAARAGAEIIVFGSGGARQMPEGFQTERAWEQLAAAARLAGEIAAVHGLTIAMEPLRRPACNFFYRVDQGIEFVDRVNHPRVRLLADLFHIAAESESFENVAAAGRRLAHVHLATPSIPETAQGVEYDFQGYLAAVRRAGYDGRLALEDNPGVMAKKKRPFAVPYRAMLDFVKAAL